MSSSYTGKAYAYCLTVNNPTMADYAMVENYSIFANRATLEYPISYFVVGYEGFARGRTPHLQMFVTYHKQMSFKEVKKHWPRAHIEVMRYSVSLAAEYCKKEGRYQEDGDIKNVEAKILDSINRKAKALREASTGGQKGKGVSITPPLAPPVSSPSSVLSDRDAFFESINWEDDRDTGSYWLN